MNTKRLKVIFSVVALAVLLTGCSTSSELITLDTSFKEIMNDGFFAAVFTYPLSQAINVLTPKVGIFMAITLVTVLLNVIVLAITFKSTVSMQRMQEMQPELQKIQAKYEGRTDDLSQQRMSMEMQALYKKYDVNPFGALAASFIQFPLLFGMYSAVRRSSAVATAQFMGHNLAMTPREAITEKVWVCVIIFVLMIVTQFISMKVSQWLAEYRGKKEADKHHKTYKKPQQQNMGMMYGMLAMIAFAMLSWPTALSLYYCIYSLVNIIKTVVVDALTHKEG